MANPIDDIELQDALAAAMGEEVPESTASSETYNLKWEPKLNPVQSLVYRSNADYILAYGERGTGKSIGGLHKLVAHCVNNANALAFVIVREVGQATDGGAWHKLCTDVLPTWKGGNYDRKLKKRIDSGMGIEFTESKYGVSDKKQYVWIGNKFGGWSKVILLSLFVGEHVEDKVKGKEPSFILFDEAQTTESNEYFVKLVQQLGRRQDIEGHQQIVFCCNPKGPSHWLYQTFFLHGKDENGKPTEWPIDPETGHPVDPATGRPITDYAIFHVPIKENIQNLPAGYWARVQNAVKNDPIEHARMIEGQWIDKPDGSAIFREYWKDTVHLRGDAVKSKGVLPVPGQTVIISYDPGSAHSSVHFEQFIQTVDRTCWLVFDELNFVGKYVPYGRRDAAGKLRGLVPNVIERLLYWEARVGEQFRYIHISDNSAFNQFRARDGSFDVQDIEQISREFVKENTLQDRFIIKMKECPKGPHSVAARVRLVTDLLLEESIVLSATCTATRDMFMFLEEDKDDRTKPKRSKYLHPFDSMSYGMFYFQAGRGRIQQKFEAQSIEPQIYAVGRKSLATN